MYLNKESLYDLTNKEKKKKWHKKQNEVVYPRPQFLQHLMMAVCYQPE